MIFLVVLCAFAGAAGYAAGCGLLLLSCWRACPLRPVPRLSYGGVLRHCTPVGGLILAGAMAVGMAALAPIAFAGWPFSVLILALAGTGAAMEGKTLPLLRPARRAILILCLAVLPGPAWALACAVCLAAPLLHWQIANADLVAGIPAALYAPPLAGAGVLLVFDLQADAGVAALIAAGALAAVHAHHRFPPRLVLGGGGVLVLIFVNLWIAAVTFDRCGWFAVLVLWALPLTAAGFCLAVLRMGGMAGAFEKARQRGEPEPGLALATASLSVANTVLVWTLWHAHEAMKLSAVAVSCFLAYQFCRFLDRGVAREPMRPPWSESV